MKWVYGTDTLYKATSPRSQQNKHATFSEIVQNSLIRHTSVKSVCGACKRNSNLISRRTFSKTRANGIASLPPVISLNASILSKEHRDSWKSKATPWTQPSKRFLPKYLTVKLDEDGLPKVVESDTVETKHGDNSVYGVRVSRSEVAGSHVELIPAMTQSVIVAIEPEAALESHLVAFVRGEIGRLR